MKRLLTVSDKLLAAVEDAVEQFQAGELMLEKGALKCSIYEALTNVKTSEEAIKKTKFKNLDLRLVVALVALVCEALFFKNTGAYDSNCYISLIFGMD